MIVGTSLEWRLLAARTRLGLLAGVGRELDITDGERDKLSRDLRFCVTNLDGLVRAEAAWIRRGTGPDGLY